MRNGAVRFHQRALKGLYFTVGSFTVLALGVGILLLLAVLLSPNARELPLR